jgi:Predicted metal-dependent hydrolase of the TIM-barrel fold
MDETETDNAVIQAVSHSECISLIPGALVMKHMSHGRFYVFGSPDLTEYYLHPNEIGKYQAEYIKRMLEAGIDGVKMLEGKPQMRKTIPIPDFDLPCWEPFWAFMEESGTAFTFHVNDPENHWSKDVSEWIKKQGWWYDESFINNEVQYSQVLTVLERHPYLKAILAHFFFMSAQLERLDDIMSRFPNVMLDLTPGIEMYENFSAQPELSRAFFDKYGDRIIYGTDIGGRCILTNEGEPFNCRENHRRPEIVRKFLGEKGEILIESDGDFLIQRKPFVMRCLNLEGKRLEMILRGNLERQIGNAPRPVSSEAVVDFCRSLRNRMELTAERDNTFRPDFSQIILAEEYFKDF